MVRVLSSKVASVRRVARAVIPQAALATLALVAAVRPAQAAEPISTDRPDFVESSLVVEAWQLQIETSVALQRRHGWERRSQEVSTPSLLRFGIGSSLELRVETDGSIHHHSDEEGPHVDGYGDLSVGLKYHILTPGPGDASTALVLHVDVPTGTHDFRGHGDQPSLRYVSEWDLPLDCSLGVMPGLALNVDEQGQRYVTGIFGLTVAHEWNDRWRSFVEIAAEELGSGRHADTQLAFDSGVAWLLTNDLQLDAAAYVGLNRNTPDITFALGFSSRW